MIEAFSPLQLKIVNLVLLDFTMHPEIEKFNYFIEGATWSFDNQFYRTRGYDEAAGKTIDTLRVTVLVTFSTADQTEELATATVITYFQLKPLNALQVTEELWNYLNRESVRHCCAYLYYKLVNTPLDYYLFPTPEDHYFSDTHFRCTQDIWR